MLLLIDSIDPEDETSAFTKTGALTIKSSSGSSGGLIAALGLSRDSSTEETVQNYGEGTSVLHRSLSDSLLKGLSGSDVSGERHRYDEQKPVVKGRPSDPNAPNAAFPHSLFQAGFPANLSPYQHPATQELGHVGDPNLQNPNPMALFPPAQPNLPQNHPVSMLQHPLWQQYGYGTLPTPVPLNQDPTMACYSAVSRPQTQTNPEQGQCGKVGLSARATQEQKKGFEERPKDLATLLQQLGLSKYQSTFDEQDVDLQVFLSLTDNDLKEIGIELV